ncbi:DUF4381 domain-containing protein [Xanthobacter autotrophicus]|jgi:hypothetical protein|uniref:DUF4381 domain-containing protein n=1 Tax=Xanthobacter autotrophicus TaxID=280 RepID=A0A6C1K8W1_XANAU|nr:DUF4381 domain-containing protein [Xanthobacter autotrophicus]TLX40715.1 DUF4381 domain-containing protein [Xanthobacter autotrophicus]
MTSPTTTAPSVPDFSTPDFLTPGGKIPDAPPAPSLEESLATLRDIHLPPDVPFWPPAPGWYALAGLVLLVGVVLAIREWRWRQTLAYKALKEFEATLAQVGAQDGGRDGLPDPQTIAVAASGVLRRLVRAQSGDEATALTGEAWARVLVAGKAGFGVAEAAFLARAPYYPPAAAPDAGIAPKAFVAAVRRWIRARA